MIKLLSIITIAISLIACGGSKKELSNDTETREILDTTKVEVVSEDTIQKSEKNEEVVKEITEEDKDIAEIEQDDEKDDESKKLSDAEYMEVEKEVLANQEAQQYFNNLEQIVQECKNMMENLKTIRSNFKDKPNEGLKSIKEAVKKLRDVFSKLKGLKKQKKSFKKAFKGKQFLAFTQKYIGILRKLRKK